MRVAEQSGPVVLAVVRAGSGSAEVIYCSSELNRVVNWRKQRRVCYNEQLVNAVEVY